MQQKAVFWFRQDLRLLDNPGFFYAAKHTLVMPIFILDEVNLRKMGECSKWWLYNSLRALNSSLNNSLSIYCGDSRSIIHDIISRYNIDAVYWNRCYDIESMMLENEVEKSLAARNVQCKSFSAHLLWEPQEIKKGDGTPYKVFTPFYKNGCLMAKAPREPLPMPSKLNLIFDADGSNELDDLGLLSNNRWYSKLEKQWNIGEKAAQDQLTKFLSNGIQDYKHGRNIPFANNNSCLSAHLKFGEISINQVWHSIQMLKNVCQQDDDIDCFASELGWREFSYNLLYYFPDLPEKNFQSKFDNFPWGYDKALFNAWKRGQTGYPIVDAGMRQLWQTGYMHNRLRMITASFLVKNLLIHWHYGRDWFWDCLLDADIANNSASWQWVAGCGADAAPYFRIFNPILQGEKFDLNGEYTRYFVPEISKLPDHFLFKPWQAPSNILHEAGVVLGENYPFPVVDLDASRKISLSAYQSL